ncbi:MAG: hypothetical protein HQL92_08070, partial [Magnetococcales bacterium]|nr:hypothetical protein [Magnetococcales bacterium]
MHAKSVELVVPIKERTDPEVVEKVVPAIKQVDSSSGAMGTAVRNAMLAMVPLIAQA